MASFSHFGSVFQLFCLGLEFLLFFSFFGQAASLYSTLFSASYGQKWVFFLFYNIEIVYFFASSPA